MYENITYNFLLGRMLERVPNNVDKREGSVIYDAIAPAAFELMQFYIALKYVMDNSFADTASREFLIRRASERGITPYPATNAVLQGEFTPTNIDMTGRRFSQPNSNVSYVVTEFISVGIYQIQCETKGIIGNQYMGTIIPIDYVSGLETAEITSLLIPASDEENAEHLRVRYFNSFSTPAFGGNIKNYIDKTMNIDGVGSVKVTPIWNGGGTVKLTILDTQFNRASDVLIDTVQTIIDPTQNAGEGFGIAPVGHVVTVDTVDEIEVNISTNVTLYTMTEWSEVEQRVTVLIQEYLSELRSSWSSEERLVARISQIETRILSVQGIIDVAGTKINGSANNLILDVHEIPVFGGISV